MIVDGRELESRISLDADICIMGGGVAGLVLARELAKKVSKVVLLESGGREFSIEKQGLYEPSIQPRSNYPDPTYSRLRFLGGSSNHWENNTSPFDPLDFEYRDWIANSGWPISYRDLEPFYPAAGSYVGVGEDGYALNYWEKVLDKPDLMSNSLVLETAIAKAANPATRFFSRFGEDIAREQAIEIYTYSDVVDIDYDPDIQQVRKVYFETAPGLRHTVNAKVCIMCFGGIENARMLLAFNEKYEDKLGNRYDNVGRYFMDHPVVRGAYFYAHDKTPLSLYQPTQLDKKVVLGFLKFREKVLRDNEITNIRMPLVPISNYIASDGISSHHILADAFASREFPDNFGTHVLNFIKDFDMVAEAISRKQFGKKLFDHADQSETYEMAMMIEQTPHRDNRIRLGKRRDKYGIARVEIDWEIKDDDKERMWRGLELVAREVGAQSLGRVRLLKERSERVWGDQLGYGHHHMGTTRMSEHERDGVVDANQRVFGTRNFYVGGSSVFPTGGHVPPTLTIVAMSLRLAEFISEEFRHG